MNAIPFDTLKMARKLESAGFTGDQAAGAAEAMADAMAGAELATKADLDHGLGNLERKIDQVDNRLELLRRDMDAKLELLRRDMTIRLGAMMIGSTGVLLTAMRFMVHP